MVEISNGNRKFFYVTRDLLQRTGAITQINTPFIEVYSRLKEIEFKSNSNNVSFEELTNLCGELVRRLPVPLMDVDVNFLIRCRPHYESNGVIYSKASDLSYNPVLDTIRKGRFNIEKEPVFYASVPSLCKAGNPRFRPY